MNLLERIYYINPENPFADFVFWKSLKYGLLMKGAPTSFKSSLWLYFVG